MELLKLSWLGHPLVELKARAVKLETRKAAALLAYLSLTPGENPREVLAAMFWPEGGNGIHVPPILLLKNLEEL